MVHVDRLGLFFCKPPHTCQRTVYPHLHTLAFEQAVNLIRPLPAMYAIYGVQACVEAFHAGGHSTAVTRTPWQKGIHEPCIQVVLVLQTPYTGQFRLIPNFNGSTTIH